VRWALAGIVVIMWAGLAHADDGLALRTHGEDSAEPLLHLDPMFAPVLESPFADEHVDVDTHFDLGKATTAALTTSEWIDASTDAHGRTTGFDARGWTTGLRVSHDFGFARLVASGSASQVTSRYGSTTYADLGLALVKLWRLSRWTTAWLSLGLDYRGASGPLPGGGAVMLRFGFTFR
jgi:hypothetical protein